MRAILISFATFLFSQASAYLNPLGYGSDAVVRHPRDNVYLNGYNGYGYSVPYGYGYVNHSSNYPPNQYGQRHHHKHHRNNGNAWPVPVALPYSGNSVTTTRHAIKPSSPFDDEYDTRMPTRRWGRRYNFDPFVQHVHKNQPINTTQPNQPTLAPQPNIVNTTTNIPNFSVQNTNNSSDNHSPKHHKHDSSSTLKKRIREFEKTLSQWMETIDVINRFRTHFGFKYLAWSNRLADNITEQQMESTKFPSIRIQNPSSYDEINMIRAVRQLIQKMMSDKLLGCEADGFCSPKPDEPAEWPWGLIDASAGELGCRCRVNEISQTIFDFDFLCNTDTNTNKSTNLFFLDLLKDRKTKAKLLAHAHHSQPVNTTLPPPQPTLFKWKSSSESSSSSSSSSSSEDEDLDLSLDAEDYNNIDFDVLNDFDVLGDVDNSNLKNLARVDENSTQNATPVPSIGATTNVPVTASSTASTKEIVVTSPSVNANNNNNISLPSTNTQSVVQTSGQNQSVKGDAIMLPQMPPTLTNAPTANAPTPSVDGSTPAPNKSESSESSSSESNSDSDDSSSFSESESDEKPKKRHHKKKSGKKNHHSRHHHRRH